MRITLREYFTALGKWIWFLVADLLGIIQQLFLDIPLIRQLPLWVWVALLIIFLTAANIHAFHKIRLQRDELARRLNDRTEIMATLTTLARLRTEGVSLRNEGMAIRDTENSQAWIGRAQDWEAKVVAEIEKLSTSQAELFRTRDWVQIRKISRQIPADLQLHVNMLSDETESLRQLIQKCDPLFTIT